MAASMYDGQHAAPPPAVHTLGAAPSVGGRRAAAEVGLVVVGDRASGGVGVGRVAEVKHGQQE